MIDLPAARRIAAELLRRATNEAGRYVEHDLTDLGVAKTIAALADEVERLRTSERLRSDAPVAAGWNLYEQRGELIREATELRARAEAAEQEVERHCDEIGKLRALAALRLERQEAAEQEVARVTAWAEETGKALVAATQDVERLQEQAAADLEAMATFSESERQARERTGFAEAALATARGEIERLAKLSMTNGQLIDLLVKRAKGYVTGAAESISRNEHMHRYRGAVLDDELVRSVVVDFLNYTIGCAGGDLGLYTRDLQAGDHAAPEQGDAGLDLLRKLASGEGGHRTGALRRAGLVEWTVTEKGRAALGEG